MNSYLRSPDANPTSVLRNTKKTAHAKNTIQDTRSVCLLSAQTLERLQCRYDNRSARFKMSLSGRRQARNLFKMHVMIFEIERLFYSSSASE